VDSKTAFVTGFTGQDGTFLTRLLLDKGYRVVALVRRISTEPPRRTRGRFDFTDEIAQRRLVLEEGDLLSPSSLNRIIGSWQPDEVYNLAAQSHVGLSFGQPEFTIKTILDGTMNLITALETAHTGEWRMYQASTSEMYGHRDQGEVFDENSRFNPNSPYAIAKFAAHQYCVMKRKQGRFISCGILFNHESEIRGGDFVTQKIVRGAVQWAIDYQEPLDVPTVLRLGNMDSKRDWGYAGDYVQGMWLMLQHHTPDDFVLATGETHTIREFATAAFGRLGYVVISNQLEGEAEVLSAITWEGKPIKPEIPAVVVDPQFFRPNDVGYLIGDASKAKSILGWEPEHKFDLIVQVMTDNAKEERSGYER
jgi:GDPmannose 4,6-dehydratase